jgi:membrane-bound lytic murein transglycosylase D
MLTTQFAKAIYLCSSFLLTTTSLTVKSVRAGTNTDRLFSNRLSPLDKPQVKLNRKSMIYVKKYIRTQKACLVGVKKRSEVPFYIIDSVFTRYHLPVELKYLAVIESELKPAATSHVGAKGPWQFMPETAHVLGLKVNQHCDERSNYYKSTIAAAKYLRDLYALFDDWLLVLAAYNGGPRPVYNAIQRSGSRNFWVLQGYLPAESREHVKKFIATHYYFEGRGSVTTLTKSENAAFKKTVDAFTKSLKSPAVSSKIKTTPIDKPTFSYDTQVAMYDMRWIIETENKKYDYPQSVSPANKSLSETAEEKFSRLMYESESSLKNSSRIIQQLQNDMTFNFFEKHPEFGTEKSPEVLSQFDLIPIHSL